MDFGPIARVAKIVALVGFFLPWVTVSCSGHPLATATGIDLLVGQISMHDPTSGQVVQKNAAPDIFLLLAFGAIVLGLLYSALERRKAAAWGMLSTATIAMVLCYLGLQAAHQLPKPGTTDTGGQAIDLAAMAMVSIDDRFGFYVTMGSLGAAVGLCSLILGQSASPTSMAPASRQSRPVARAPPAEPKPADADLAFWDAITDKTDGDLLTEYLIRFPQGRFVELARIKLERLGRAPPETPIVDAAKPVQAPTIRQCRACGAETPAEARYCEGCGGLLSGAPT